MSSEIKHKYEDIFNLPVARMFVILTLVHPWSVIRSEAQII